MTIFIGTAGWSIRREQTEMFDGGSSHLARYAGRFIAVEINSSFYKPHRAATYARWTESVPGGFRFSVKLPRATNRNATSCWCIFDNTANGAAMPNALSLMGMLAELE